MRILFMCVENAGRSQMAEALARKWAPPGMEILSAGSQPAQRLNPMVVEALKELGIDISDKKPKGLSALPDGVFDIVVGMGCGDACPVTRAKRIFTWDIPNPKGQPIEVVRQIRDTIQEKVKSLMETLK